MYILVALSDISQTSVCPGQYFAANTVAIFAASVLHVFDIAAGFNKAGDPIHLGTDIMEGVVP